MKGIVCLFLCIGVNFGLFAQNVNIPDVNFKNFLLTHEGKIDANNDGEIDFVEAENFTGKIDISVVYTYSSEGNYYYYKSLEIYDLTGIEAFINMTVFRCVGNQFTNLDFSNNVNLDSLDCSDNSYYDYNTSTQVRSLTSLNVSNNVNLTYLNCSGNNLTNLDISKNYALKYLYCSSNKLTSLNIFNNYNLNELNCSENKITSLNFLYKNYKLEVLNCNDNQLTSLDVSNNYNLKNLYFGWNKISSINLNNNVNLESLGCYLTSLKELDISKNVNLFEMGVEKNELTSIDLSKNIKLKTLWIGYNKLINLDVSKNVNLWVLKCDSNDFTNLDVSKNLKLEYLSCSKNSQLNTICISPLQNTKQWIKDDFIQLIDCTITSTSQTTTQKSSILKAYNLQGIEVPVDTKGQMIILLYSDGKTEKVFKD